MMEPLPTHYRGIHFRSRLEAKWACLFDSLEISYEYEPQTFQIEPTLSYLPDFWLPSQKIWVEIKPDAPMLVEERKAIGLHRITGQRVYIFAGFPALKVFSVKEFGYRTEICNFGIFVVDENCPESCNSYSIGRLNETMLYILGSLTQFNDKETYKTRGYQLVDAVRRSNDHFAQPYSLRDLVQKFLKDNSPD